MPILDQDFYTGYNTVKDVAQSVAVGREVDRKANLMGSLGELYKQNPQPALEDLRAQYAVHGTPDDLARLDEKIYNRDLTKASVKFQTYQSQLTQAKATNDLKAQKAIADNMNLDPDVAKFIGNVQMTPTGEFTFTAMQRMKYPNPANPSEMIDVLPNDQYQLNANGELTKVNSQQRISLQQTQTKALGRGTGKATLPQNISDILTKVQNTQASEGQANAVALFGQYLNDPGFISQLAAMDPAQEKEYRDQLRKVLPAATFDKMMGAIEARKSSSTPPGKTIKRTGKTKDGRKVIEYTDGTQEIK